MIKSLVLGNMNYIKFHLEFRSNGDNYVYDTEIQ